MEKKPTERSATEPQVPATDPKTAVEIETIFKKTLQAIGRHTILAYEIENDQIQLDTIKLSDTAMNSIISNRYTLQKEALDKKNEALLKEQATSVEGISEIADKYKELFSTGLKQVREEIEGAMIKYGDILSKDTLGQINKESARLTEQLTSITDKQAENLQTLGSDLKVKTQRLDNKFDEVKAAMDAHSQDSVKLFAANNKCVQTSATIDNKITKLQRKMDEMSTHFEKRITSTASQTESQTTAMEKISTVISDKLKEDKESFIRRLEELQGDRQTDKKVLETLKSEFKAIKKQLELLSRNETVPATPSPSHFQTQSQTHPSASLGDKELVSMKSNIASLQLKCKELFQLINTLAESGTTPITSMETMENLKVKMSLQRLDDVEKNVVYLLSKVEVMEPRYKLDFAEVKKMLETKGVLSKDQQIPSLGDKRSHEIMARGTDDEDRILRLEEEVKRVDFKLASLVEYIHRFRSNVLHPTFPDKLDTGLQHMEEVLKNHEMFIAYLVDPVAASNSTDDGEPPFTLTASDLGKQHEHNPSISPALLTTIGKLVADKTKKELEQYDQGPRKQNASDQSSDKSIPEYMEKYMAKFMADQVEPLKKKISDLERKLRQEDP
ncbi:hypothetical protein BCR42DRAFT_180718 [Absidia repens]|uniref:Uncharacterized protein n=1 Tax=Absidia repens TaxID=90262 RepID=A0A1X2HYS8_9FUNG|nr:hypothetical protein BCR42DRAFT_180718 [Absidia repens]